MPEIWLNYDTTNVVLDIKVENLLKTSNKNFSLIEDEIIDENLSSINLEKVTLVPLNNSKSVMRVLDRIIKKMKKDNENYISVESIPSTHKTISQLEGVNKIMECKGDEEYFVKKMKDRNTIFISNTSLDPFFGFAGTPTIITRKLKDKMALAYFSRSNNIPIPGIKSNRMKIVMETFENSEAKSVEVISNNEGIHRIWYGFINNAFEESINTLEPLILPQDNNVIKSMIVTSGNDCISVSTLSESLTFLWNCIHILKLNGSVILISESKKGLGSTALDEFSKGKIGFEKCYNGNYYEDGLEHLLFLNELKKKYSLGILSTLPRFYLKSLLGFRVYPRIQDVLEKLLISNGKNQKVLVVDDPNIALFKKE